MQRSASREYLRERREFTAELKVVRGCRDCGYRENSCALDFDHLPGTVKLFDVGMGSWRSREVVLAEIAKCEVVCACCHRVRTKDRNVTRDELLSLNYLRNRGFLEAFKLERGCADCGYNEYACALDFDHLPGREKSFTVGNCVGLSREKLLAEIAKCEVVCANCHRVRTTKRAKEYV